MVALGLTAAIVAGWCLLLPFVGPRLGFVETPGEDPLKTHVVPAVPLAGPGMLLAAMVGLSLVAELSSGLVVGLTLLTAIGVVDDRWSVAPVVRIGVELGAAAIIATRWWDHGVLVTVAGAVAVVVAVNAVNLYDGIDGLAGGTGLVSLLVVAGVGWLESRPYGLPLVLAATTVGFLPFNHHPARVFLGDGGAYLLGAGLAIGIWDLGVTDGWVTLIAGLGLMGMFAVDLVATILRRVKTRQPMFQGDRNHLYDRLLAAGSSVPGVYVRLVGAHLVIVALCGALVLWAPPVPALIGVVAVGLVAVAWSWTVVTDR